MSSSRVTYRMTAERLAALGGLRVTGTAYSLTVETVSPDQDATVTVTGTADQVSAVREMAGAPGETWSISLPEASAITSPGSVNNVIHGGVHGGGSVVQMGNVVSGGDLIVSGGSINLGGATARTAPRLPLHVRVRLPRGSGITVQQTTGVVRTLGYLGGVHITGTSSEVDIEAADRATVNVDTGDVRIVRAEAATVTTTSGDIDITHTRTATLTSTSGDLRAGACADGTITARSVSGDVAVYRRGHTVMVTAQSGASDAAVY